MPNTVRYQGSFIERGWRNVREAGPRRLVLTGLLVVLALFVARYGWLVPGVADAERAMYDFRSFEVANRSAIPQDDRVVMVVYNDGTLAKVQKRSPLDRGLLAEALENIDAMGAKAIGIDILFDQPQAEDDRLIEVLRDMKTPVAVGYANMDTNASSIGFDQQKYLESFLARLEGTNARPGSVRLSDQFGVTRQFPEIRDDLPPVLGRAMLEDAGEAKKSLPGYIGSIRYRLSSQVGVSVFASLAIEDFTDPEFAALYAPLIEGKYVLIGGEIRDTDRVPTTLSEAMGTPEPPGLMVHAELLAQMLDGEAMPSPLGITLWTFAILFVTMAVLTGLLEWGSFRIYILLGVQFVVMLGIPFFMAFRGVDTYGLPAIGWILGWILAFLAITSAARTAGAVQRNFAQGALGKYLPAQMAKEIIDHPELLSLHGEKKNIYVLFSDLEGFTKMSHALQPEQVAKLVNKYLDMLSDVVLDHGGVLDKFIGDAVVAFWGAPIARDDDATRAAQAGYAIWQAGEQFREDVAKMDPNLPKIGKTRVGLHYGEAVVGNFGGDSRIQYTALGDSMNTAARLEAANKALGSAIMASREFAERSKLDFWRPMGRVLLRGRAKPVELMQPAPDFPEEDRKELIQAMILADSDNAKAIEVVEKVFARHPDDKALENLLYRLRNLSEGNAYALG